MQTLILLVGSALVVFVSTYDGAQWIHLPLLLVHGGSFAFGGRGYGGCKKHNNKKTSMEFDSTLGTSPCPSLSIISSTQPSVCTGFPGEGPKIIKIYTQSTKQHWTYNLDERKLTNSTCAEPVTGKAKWKVLAEEAVRRSWTHGGNYKHHCLDLRFNVRELDGKWEWKKCKTAEYEQIRQAVARLQKNKVEQTAKKATKKVQKMSAQMQKFKEILAEKTGSSREHRDLKMKFPKIEKQRDKALQDVNKLKNQLHEVEQERDAARVQVSTRLYCAQYHCHYHHTTTLTQLSSHHPELFYS